jgi:hypothetical protein
VTERKVCLFLKEAAFKRKRAVKKGGKDKKRKRGDASSDGEESGDEAVPGDVGQGPTVLNVDPDTKQWAAERQITPDDLLDMIEDDREALDGRDAAGLPEEVESGGHALAYKTIEGYLSGIAELHRNQVKTPLPPLLPFPSIVECLSTKYVLCCLS